MELLRGMLSGPVTWEAAIKSRVPPFSCLPISCTSTSFCGLELKPPRASKHVYRLLRVLWSHLGCKQRTHGAQLQKALTFKQAGVTHCFVNLGSDHPSIMEAIVKGQRERPESFPQIITCPNEMAGTIQATFE